MKRSLLSFAVFTLAWIVCAEPQTVLPSAVQLLPHGLLSELEAEGTELVSYAGWTRGYGLVTWDLSDLAKPSMKSGVLMPGYVLSRAKSADGKYMYVATLFGLAVLEKTEAGWVLKRTMMIAFSPFWNRPGLQVAVEGDRLYLKGGRENRVFDITHPGEPVLLECGAGLAKDMFPSKKKVPVVANGRHYEIAKTKARDIVVKDEAGAVLATIPNLPQDGDIAVTDKAVYFASGNRLAWFALKDLGRADLPSYADFDLPMMRGAHYNLLTVPLKVVGRRLCWDHAVLDISDPFAPKLISKDGAPAIGGQTGSPFIRSLVTAGRTYAIDRSNFYVLSDKGETNAMMSVDAPCVLECVGSVVYTASGTTGKERNVYAYDMESRTMRTIPGLLSNGASVAASDGRRLYLSDGLQVKAFDLSDPLMPCFAETYAGGGPGYPEEGYADATGLVVANGKLYLKRYSRIVVWEVRK